MTYRFNSLLFPELVECQIKFLYFSKNNVLQISVILGTMCRDSVGSEDFIYNSWCFNKVWPFIGVAEFIWL